MARTADAGYSALCGAPHKADYQTHTADVVTIRTWPIIPWQSNPNLPCLSGQVWISTIYTVSVGNPIGTSIGFSACPSIS